MTILRRKEGCRWGQLKLLNPILLKLPIMMITVMILGACGSDIAEKNSQSTLADTVIPGSDAGVLTVHLPPNLSHLDSELTLFVDGQQVSVEKDINVEPGTHCIGVGVTRNRKYDDCDVVVGAGLHRHYVLGAVTLEKHSSGIFGETIETAGGFNSKPLPLNSSTKEERTVVLPRGKYTADYGLTYPDSGWYWDAEYPSENYIYRKEGSHDINLAEGEVVTITPYRKPRTLIFERQQTPVYPTVRQCLPNLKATQESGLEWNASIDLDVTTSVLFFDKRRLRYNIELMGMEQDLVIGSQDTISVKTKRIDVAHLKGALGQTIEGTFSLSTQKSAGGPYENLNCEGSTEFATGQGLDVLPLIYKLDIKDPVTGSINSTYLDLR